MRFTLQLAEAHPTALAMVGKGVCEQCEQMPQTAWGVLCVLCEDDQRHEDAQQEWLRTR